jgi:hypothetical protein
MADLKEQNVCIKFSFTLGKTISAVHEIPKTAFSDNDMGRTQHPEWVSPFKHRKTLVEHCECSGCPATCHTEETVEKVHNSENKN